MSLADDCKKASVTELAVVVTSAVEATDRVRRVLLESHVDQNKDRMETQRSLLTRELWQSCQNCINRELATNKCSLAKAMPPLNIYVVGCERWEAESYIPF